MHLWIYVYLCGVLFLQLPQGVEISDSCRDLLHGLLQRDPDERMTYEKFLQHPFIDLEHRPSAESIEIAVSFTFPIYVIWFCVILVIHIFEPDFV